MESLSGLLGGLGVLGILLAGFLGFVTLLALPFWAIIECACSRRSGGLKVFLLILLVLTWGFGSLVYGLFVTTSKALRGVTVVALAGVLAILVPSVVSLLTGAGIHSNLLAERTRREKQQIAAQFRPASIPARDLDAFHALHFTHGPFGPATAALARFTGARPDFESARDTDNNVRRVAVDAASGRTWALTAHEFGAIDPSSGRFASIEVDPSLGDFSWPKGVAIDPRDRSVYVMTSHVFTSFYRFAPETSDWERLPTEIRDLPLVALAFSPADGCLYALEYRAEDRALRRLHRFNTAGASLGPVELHPAVPIPERAEDLFQLQASGDKLALILPPMSIDGTDPSEPNRTFAVDPTSGEVLAPDDAS